MVLATTSLPVPLSPEMNTVARVGATFAIKSNNRCMGSDSPYRLPKRDTGFGEPVFSGVGSSITKPACSAAMVLGLNVPWLPGPMLIFLSFIVQFAGPILRVRRALQNRRLARPTVGCGLAL